MNRRPQDDQHDVDGQLRLRQVNLNKSMAAQQDFINNTDPAHYDLLAIQEPYKKKNHLTVASSKWHVVYPTTHFVSDTQAAATRIGPVRERYNLNELVDGHPGGLPGCDHHRDPYGNEEDTYF